MCGRELVANVCRFLWGHLWADKTVASGRRMCVLPLGRKGEVERAFPAFLIAFSKK